jgi:hypothetical protein
MRRFFKKSTLSFFLIILSFFIIFYFSCTITEIAKIASDPDFDPEWDVDLRALVVDYSTSPISFESYVKDKALNSISLSQGGIAEWPPSVAIPDLTQISSIVVTPIDIDNDTVDDFNIDGYYKEDPNMLRIQIWLTDSANNILPISSSDITITSVIIEGATINFESTSTTDNKLNYYSTNFLNSSAGYYLDLGGDNDVDYDITIHVNTGTPVYNSDTYTLYVVLSFNLEDDFGVAGQIIGNGILKSAANQPIPINNLPLEAIKDFHLEFEYDSNLPFDLNITNTFHGSDQTPSPDNFSTVIDSGVLSTRTGYNYVSDLNYSTDSFKFDDNILDYGNMSVDLEIRLPGSSPLILLETDSFIRIRVIASGEATISL